jgi:hypothetical protein
MFTHLQKALAEVDSALGIAMDQGGDITHLLVARTSLKAALQIEVARMRSIAGASNA